MNKVMKTLCALVLATTASAATEKALNAQTIQQSEKDKAVAAEKQKLPSEVMIRLTKPGQDTPYKIIMLNTKPSYTPFQAEKGDIVDILNADGTPIAGADVLIRPQGSQYLNNDKPLEGCGPRAFSLTGIDTKNIPDNAIIEYYPAKEKTIRGKHTVQESKLGHFLLTYCEPCPEAKENVVERLVLVPAVEDRKGCRGDMLDVAVYKSIGGSRNLIGGDIAWMHQIKKKDESGNRVDSKWAIGGGVTAFTGKQTITDTMQDSIYLGHIRGKTENITKEDLFGVGPFLKVKYGDKVSVFGDVGFVYLMENFKDTLKQTATDINTGLPVRDPVLCSNEELIKEFVPRVGLGISAKIGKCLEIGASGLAYFNFPTDRTITYKTTSSEIKLNQKLGSKIVPAARLGITYRF